MLNLNCLSSLCLFKQIGRFAIFLLVSILFLTNVKQATASSLWLTPPEGDFGVGSTIEIEVGVDTQDENINALQAIVGYPQELLQFVNISTQDSVLSFFSEKEESGGQIYISGGVYSPGFTGNKQIAVLTFKVIGKGIGKIEFSDSSSVLRSSDSAETLTAKNSGTYNFYTEGFVPTLPPPTRKPDKAPVVIKTAVNLLDITVERVEKKSATISWITDRDSTSEVYFGETEELLLSQTNMELTSDHKVKIEPLLLAPGTKYYFKVRSVDTNGGVGESEISTFITQGYIISVTILDTTGNPLPGIEVVLTSHQQISTTDDRGVVIFKNVAPGKHRITVKHLNKTLAQDIEVEEKDQVQYYEAKFAPKNMETLSPLVKFVTGVFIIVVGSVIVGILLAVFLKLKKWLRLHGPVHDSVVMGDLKSSPDKLSPEKK